MGPNFILPATQKIFPEIVNLRLESLCIAKILFNDKVSSNFIRQMRNCHYAGHGGAWGLRV